MARCINKPKSNQQQTSTGMEMSFEVTSCPRIRWKVKVPEPESDHVLQSPIFKYRNAEYCLACLRYSDEICLSIEPQSESSNLSMHYSITVQVENCVGYILPYQTDIYSQISKEGWIWQRSISEINEVYPDFCENCELTFIVRIHAEEFESSTDPETLKLFMRYLYTGSLEEVPTFEATMALYEAAGKYEVKSLFRWCAHYLLEHLTVENACDVLAVADAHSDEELVEKVTVFVLENKMPISDDEPWSTFCDSHSKLANKVYRRFCKMVCK